MSVYECRRGLFSGSVRGGRRGYEWAVVADTSWHAGRRQAWVADGSAATVTAAQEAVDAAIDEAETRLAAAGATVRGWRAR